MTSPSPQLGRVALGRRGESLAAQWYERRGYNVIERNWRCREGEIDLVLRSDAVLVICEVKTRSSSLFGAPVEAVNEAKQRRVRRLAALYMSTLRHEYAPDVRFDVAAVQGSEVQVFEGAF